MTLIRILTLGLTLGLLTACLPGLAGKQAKTAESPINGPAVTTTTLPAPGASPVPAPPPAAPPAATAPAPPPPVTDPQALDCLAKGGQWANVGEAGFKACVLPTGDGGKQCRAKTDCEGECLARSGSCSPIAPLFGCNDILTEGGLRVTQCIN